MKISLELGDITKIAFDAIVNAANCTGIYKLPERFGL